MNADRFPGETDYENDTWLWDDYAKAAITGLMSDPTLGWSAKNIAHNAFAVADAAMLERKKRVDAGAK